uniref:Uncharacterized protein n=1 Tax=Kalanchoe fedtschenkoi TaxID=63787 RepID=A0A7N0RDH5_KALFE
MSGLEAEVASAIVSALLSKEVFTFFSTWDLDTSLLDQLETQLNSVEALLRDAEEKLIERNVYVEEWVQKARFAIYDADDFLDKTLADAPNKDKIKNKVKDIGRAIHPHKKTIEEEMGEIIAVLQFLAAQKDALGLREKSELTSYREGRLPSTLVNESSFIHGRSVDTKMIMLLLNSREGKDDALRVIPIVGMGGIGKTTLACLVFNEYQSLNQSFGLTSWLGRLARCIHNRANLPEFDLKGWVQVSDKFDATRVIKSLLEYITGQKKSTTSFEFLQQELRYKLQGKRFLIVLDDFWSTKPEDWDVLQICFSAGAPGSRIIVTTRSIEVARTVTTTRDFFYELNKLSKDESWTLFENNVFGKENPNACPRLIDIGKEIVSKCDGLPLAIKMIGGLLRSKGDNAMQWTSVLNSENWENTKIISSLRLSYYNLPVGVKECFAYCSIFRKDYTFSMEEMVMLWMGEGLIDKFGNDNSYEDVARTYFDLLCSTFFFLELSSGTSKFVMHNLIHDLAVSVSRGVCVDLDNVNVQSRRLSYMQGKEEPRLNSMSGTKVYHLRTFLPLREGCLSRGQQGFRLENKLFRDLLSSFKLLRVLCLGGYLISKLPDSIGDMKLLRYLDLSNTNIDHLPDKMCRLCNLQILLLFDCQKLKGFPAAVCNLTNLRHLDLSRSGIDSVPDKIRGLHHLRILLLSGCRNLTRLPSEIYHLVNLRHLHIDGTNLEEMPDGIGKMRNIQTLSNFVVGGGKSKQMREFKELFNLQGKLVISRLNNVEDAKDVVVAGFRKKEYIEELVLEWERSRARGTELDDEKVLNAIDAHNNLKSLTIQGYGGKRLSDWIVGVGPSFTGTVSLCIADCSNCEALPSLGKLPFLKNLKIERLDRVESFGEEFYGDSRNPFQALEKLIIDDMKVLKTWRLPEGDRLGFQMLQDVQIVRCSELTMIPYCFPSLSRLAIINCHNLIKLKTCGEAKAGSSSVTVYGHPFQSIHFSSCPKLEEIPNNFVNSDSFDIKDCKRLVSVPRLQHVRKLTLTDVGASLPVEAALQECRDEVMEELTIGTSLSDLNNAQIYRFTSLKRLKLLIPIMRPENGEVMIRLPPNLSDITICHGTLHEHTKMLTELSNLNSLTKLEFYECGALESLPDVALPSTLKYLTVYRCSALRNIPDRLLSRCSESLQELRIDNCRSLMCLPSTLSTLLSLQTLHISGCDGIHQLPTIYGSAPNYLTNLSDLRISDCGALECLPDGFHKATTLHTFYMDNCPNLSVNKDRFPVSIRGLCISDCGKMKPFVKTVLPTLTSLTHLELRGFLDIRSLDHCLPESIQTLKIWSFPRLKSLSGVLPNLKHLRKLEVEDCPRVDPKSWS